MRILVVALVTALLVFAIATVASDLLLPSAATAGRPWALRNPAATSVPVANTSRRKAKPALSDDETPPPARSAAKSARKPIHTASESRREGDLNEELTSFMGEQLTELRQQEARLVARQEALRMIYDDIRVEQVALDDLRSKVNTELVAVQRRGAEIAARDRNIERGIVPRSDAAPVGDVTTAPRGEMTNPPTANSIDGQATRETALLIRRLAQEGSFSSAVSLLSTLKERDAAKVLASLSRLDPQMAASLTDNLQSSKQPVRR